MMMMLMMLNGHITGVTCLKCGVSADQLLADATPSQHRGQPHSAYLAYGDGYKNPRGASLYCIFTAPTQFTGWITDSATHTESQKSSIHNKKLDICDRIAVSPSGGRTGPTR